MKRIALGLALVVGLVVAALLHRLGRAQSAIVAHCARPSASSAGRPGRLSVHGRGGRTVDSTPIAGAVRARYVGHDEPSLLFYSNAAGLGQQQLLAT